MVVRGDAVEIGSDLGVGAGGIEGGLMRSRRALELQLLIPSHHADCAEPSVSERTSAYCLKNELSFCNLL